MPTVPRMATQASGDAQNSPSHEEVALLAYQYWEARGRPVGSPEEDWFRAEQDILIERLVWGAAAPKPHSR